MAVVVVGDSVSLSVSSPEEEDGGEWCFRCRRFWLGKGVNVGWACRG